MDYWFDAQQLSPGDNLSTDFQRAIGRRDIFIRVCTSAAQASYWVQLETGAFRGLQAEERRGGRGDGGALPPAGQRAQRGRSWRSWPPTAA